MSYKTNEKIPPFSFLILSLKYCRDSKQREVIVNATEKYLQNNCPVLDDSLLNELKSISKDYLDLNSLYRKVQIKPLSRGKLIVDMDLVITLNEDSLAEISVYSSIEHVFYASDMKTVLYKLNQGNENVSFIYKPSYFGGKMKESK